MIRRGSQLDPEQYVYHYSNCAGFRVCNELMLGGSQLEDIDFDEVTIETLQPAERCDYCKVTTDGVNALADKGGATNKKKRRRR